MDLTEIINEAQHLITSPVGIAIGSGSAAAIITGTIANYVQQREANVFPAVLSKSESVYGRNEALRFYSTINDLCMTVTNAWNLSREAKSYSGFVRELKQGRIEIHAVAIDEIGNKLLKKLRRHCELRDSVAETAEALNQSWDYHSHDNYIYVPSVVSNGKGGTKITMKRTYSNTDHNFDFDSEKAEVAQKMLENMLKIHTPKTLHNPDFTVQLTPNSQDIKAIQKTVFEDESRIATPEELNEIFTQWASKARANVTLGEVNNQLSYLINSSPGLFFTINNSEAHYHFNTSSRNHNGPAGYRASEKLRNTCREISSNIHNLDSSIHEVIDKTKYFLNLPETGSKKVAQKSLDIAVESYLASFPDSTINMDQRTSAGGTAFLALGVGVAAGIGAYALQQYM
ncbi:MAG: hypothetical protein V1914_00430 [archaeon]